MKFWTICFIVALCSVATADMLADITQPVETPFGTYVPKLVTCEPQAPACQPGDHLERVVNLGDFEFSEMELAALKKNHFVVLPAVRADGSGYNEIFDLYNECRELGLPQFITTDAMLHGFHLMFDYILRTCEEERFIIQLGDLLAAMQTLSTSQYEQATDKRVREAIFRNRDYLLVASQLLNPQTYPTDPLPEGNYGKELELINKAEVQLVESPIFGYPEDYTQYKPRGHYTKNQELQRYFRAMMWLGRMTFSCEDDSDYALDMTLSALLLTQAISQVNISDENGLQIWDNIYQPTVFFVGKSDDINFPQYLPICYDIYGKSFPIYPPDTFADETKLKQFLAATADFPAAAIGYPGQPTKGFRFMGQRFVPDSWVLDELVYNKIPFRLMPTGLDVMMVLGHAKQAQSEWAFQYLSERDKQDNTYVAKLDTLKSLFHGYTDNVWAQNAYWNWLYCLMPLLMPKGEGYPWFMQTNSWRDKDLHAALASWAELRHDTILYVKQSGTERGLPPSAVESQGYVEPNPHLYARLSALADFMHVGLASRDVLFDNFARHLTLFATLADELKTISEKELTNIPLSSDDYLTIFEFGKTLYDIVTFQLEIPSEGPQIGGMENVDPMPVIADVHYDSNSGQVLEEAVGFPYAIYVICDVEGQPTIVKGAGFSYYEFTQPAHNRLTDEQWRDMLETGTNPPPPHWTASFCTRQTHVLQSTSFFEWKKPETLGLLHDLPETVREGASLVFSFSINDDRASDVPIVHVIDAEGFERHMPVQRDAARNRWSVTSETDGWPLGITYIEIEKGSGEHKLYYRMHFVLGHSTIAPKPNGIPAQFALSQNYPNPFNPQTFFKIELPREAFISLRVFDIRGRKVRTLVSSVQPAGQYIVPWDGTDDAGNSLTSGIYYYQMQADRFSDVKRMILLR
ncbi:DUF3160 domain-containing protein [candidate division KSB1 bacterium]|nr:DUF3160 domain-containing protein [candidate division KSB1 bacterium]